MKKIIIDKKENSDIIYLSDIEEDFSLDTLIKCWDYVLISTYNDHFDWMSLEDFVIRSDEKFETATAAIEWLKGYLNVTNDEFYYLHITELLK